MSTITADTTLADLVAMFNKYGLDFCCHGNVSLKETCNRNGINLEMTIEETRPGEQVVDQPFDRWRE